MRILLTLCLFLIVAISNVNGQWIQSKNLLGGSIVRDMIEYKNSLYVAMDDHGVFKSEDNGNTWNHVKGFGYWSYGVFAIHNDQLLACTSNALYKTSDGEMWAKEHAPGTFVNDIESEGTTIIIATIEGVFKSEDEGATWIDINNEHTAIQLKSVTFEGSTLWIGGDNGALFKSTDTGSTWSKVEISTTSSVSQIIAFEENLYLNIGYDGLLKSIDGGNTWSNITDLDQSINYVSKVHIDSTNIVILSLSDIYTSENGGNSWIRKGKKISSFSPMTMLVTKDNMFVGTWGGGIFINNRAVDLEWEAKNSGISLIATNDILVNNNEIFLGTDLSFVRSSKDEAETWDQKTNNYGSSISRVWSMLSSGDYLFAGLSGGGVYRSNNSGTTWEIVNSGLTNTAVCGLAANDIYIFAGTGGGFFRSEDFGNHWIDKTEGITAGIKNVFANDSYVLVSTWNGLFLSEDHGDTWNKISAGLPNESVEKVLFVDSVLFVATQYNGLHKTSDLGLNWKQVNGNSVNGLAKRNEYIFMGSRHGMILASPDMGEIWIQVGDQLPDGIVSAIDFTENYLIAGTIQPGFGIWKRPLHEVVPPALTFYSAKSDSTFVTGQPIYVKSDQELRDAEGKLLDSVTLSKVISVKDNQNQEVNFIAQIDTNNKLIELVIEGLEDEKYYTITVDSLHNLSGFSTAVAHSRGFKALKNNPPSLVNLSMTKEVESIINFRISDFTETFDDLDGDTLVKIMIKSIPAHGTLSIGDQDVSIEAEISIEKIGKFTYTPYEGFSGNDQFTWSGHDGVEYSVNDAVIHLNVSAITAIPSFRWSSNDILVHPNPVSEQLTINLGDNVNGICHVQVLHVSGRVIKDYTLTKTSTQEKTKINLSDIPEGIYIVKVNSSNFNAQRKFIKKD